MFEGFDITRTGHFVDTNLLERSVLDNALTFLQLQSKTKTQASERM